MCVRVIFIYSLCDSYENNDSNEFLLTRCRQSERKTSLISYYYNVSAVGSDGKQNNENI